MRSVIKSLVSQSMVLLAASTALAAPADDLLENLRGTVKLSNCSASFVAFEGYQPTDAALILTNGHCLDQGSLYGSYPGPGEVFYHAPTAVRGGSLNTGNPTKPRLSLTLREVLYGTMTDTDMALLVATDTYQSIKDKVGTEPFILAKDAHTTLTLGTKIRMTSSYWKNSDVCSFEKSILKMREGQWTWAPSMRLTSECKVEHGSSGSPLILEGTQLIVGVINTMYENGQACEENNPCEVGPNGEISTGTASQPYGQFVDGVYSCLNAKRELDLSVKGCVLPKPAPKAEQDEQAGQAE